MNAKTETKIRDTSVYPVKMPDGEVRYIKAVSRSAAVLHAFKPNVGSPLTGGQVADLVLKHGGAKVIEIAGEPEADVAGSKTPEK